MLYEKFGDGVSLVRPKWEGPTEKVHLAHHNHHLNRNQKEVSSELHTSDADVPSSPPSSTLQIDTDTNETQTMDELAESLKQTRLEMIPSQLSFGSKARKARFR